MGSMGETTGSGTGETTGSGNEETTGAETTASIGGSTAAAATTTPTPAPTTAASNAFTAEFCADNAEHTMCKYTGIGSVCTADPNHITGFTTAGKDLILQKHNELRSKVASGNEAGQPAATNMRRLVWNQELETVAQRWGTSVPSDMTIVEIRLTVRTWGRMLTLHIIQGQARRRL